MICFWMYFLKSFSILIFAWNSWQHCRIERYRNKSNLLWCKLKFSLIMIFNFSSTYESKNWVIQPVTLNSRNTPHRSSEWGGAVRGWQSEFPFSQWQPGKRLLRLESRVQNYWFSHSLSTSTIKYCLQGGVQRNGKTSFTLSLPLFSITHSSHTPLHLLCCFRISLFLFTLSCQHFYIITVSLAFFFPAFVLFVALL